MDHVLDSTNELGAVLPPSRVLKTVRPLAGVPGRQGQCRILVKSIWRREGLSIHPGRPMRPGSCCTAAGFPAPKTATGIIRSGLAFAQRSSECHIHERWAARRHGGPGLLLPGFSPRHKGVPGGLGAENTHPSADGAFYFTFAPGDGWTPRQTDRRGKGLSGRGPGGVPEDLIDIVFGRDLFSMGWQGAAACCCLEL